MPIDKPRGFFAALLIGLLALPVAAIALARGPSDPEVTVDTEAAVVPVAQTRPELSEPGIAQACGPDAQPLLDKERTGTLSAIEQAALDALRPICADAGLALPAPPARSASGQPAIQTLGTVATTTPTTQVDEQWALGQYDVEGGSAGVEFSTDQARVAFVDENPGFTASISQSSPQDIEVRFSSANHDSIVRVTMVNGEWSVTTTEQPKGGGAYDDDEDRDDDDGGKGYDDDDRGGDHDDDDGGYEDDD